MNKNEMASELFAEGRPKDLLGERFEKFVEKLDELCNFKYDFGPRGVTRENIYDKYITDGSPAQGRYKQITDEWEQYLTFSIKKLVDLRYNTNLADLMNRYTFTPMGLPSRVALQDEWRGRNMNAGLSQVSDKLDEMRGQQFFMARHQKLLQLPDIDSWNIRDIHAVHTWEEHKKFVQCQRAILDNVFDENIKEKLEKLDLATINLQEKLTRHHQETYPNKPLNLEKYYQWTHLVLTVGGIAIALGYPDKQNIPLLLGALGGVEIFKGFTLEIAHKAVNIVHNAAGSITRKINPRHSWKVQAFRSDAEITREEIKIFIEKLQDRTKDDEQIDGQNQQFASESK